MSHVQLMALSDCCEIISGATPSTSVDDFWDGDVCWATPKDLSNLEGHYISDTPRKLTQKGLKSCAATVLPANSVLFSSRAPIGHVAMNTVPMATNQGFKSFIPKVDVMDAKFLFHWLRTNRTYLESLGNGATFKEVSKAIVAKIKVPVPPIPEQRRIAAILDQADALRVKRREALGQLDSLTQSIFIEMFGDPIDNPNNHKVSKLIELVDATRPISYGILMPGPDVDGGVKYVRVVDMKNGGIALSGIRRTTEAMSNSFKRSLLKPGDLLMSIRGHVGRMAVIPQELDGANITQDSARLAIVGANLIYVRECLRTVGFQRWMARHTKGVAVRGINLGDVKLMPIPLPPANLQDEFAQRAMAIDNLMADHKEALKGASNLFASLQHRAFRGEL